jgi:uncharacterized membrane protein
MAMGFWVFMLAMDLIMPITMIAFGRRFEKRPPGTVNPVFGYRTAMSMKNRETWEFAHHHFGRTWKRWGMAILPLSVIALLPFAKKDTRAVGTAGGIFCVIQLLVMISTIFLTERALKRNFDADGNRR